MTEIVRTHYQCLFEVRLLHHYWLDDGATVFDLITDIDKKNRILSAYDRRAFLNVTPTGATVKIIKGLGGVYRDTALGFIVAIPNHRIIPNDIKLEFALSVSHADFFNYTALTLPRQEIVEIDHKPEDKTYRYKSNVFVLSNLTGVTRGSGDGKSLFLSSRYNTRSADDKIEALVSLGSGLSQLTAEMPGSPPQRISTRTTALPAFMHQGDLPTITPPAGMIGAPEKGVLLTGDIADNVFALLNLFPLRSANEDFSFSQDGRPKTPHTIYQLRFKNRSTVRRYLHKRSGSIESTESTATPLTYFGNAGNRHKPTISTGITTEISGAKITRLISEIFL